MQNMLLYEKLQKAYDYFEVKREQYEKVEENKQKILEIRKKSRHTIWQNLLLQLLFFSAFVFLTYSFLYTKWRDFLDTLPPITYLKEQAAMAEAGVQYIWAGVRIVINLSLPLILFAIIYSAFIAILLKRKQKKAKLEIDKIKTQNALLSAELQEYYSSFAGNNGIDCPVDFEHSNPGNLADMIISIEQEADNQEADRKDK